MKTASWKKAGLALAMLGSVAWTSAARGGDESRAYKFRAAPVNSMGVKGMADLLGKPVLIDFWGTR